jgi:hypothetical protein
MTVTNITLQQPNQIWIDYSVDASTKPGRYYRVNAVSQ